ncbi:SsgA family sporulation/cell division regulator [Streptomyces sp. NPDC004726]
MSAYTLIEQAVEARLIAPAPAMKTVPVTLRYRSDDPFAVRIAFPPPATLEGTEVSWVFSRELLATGVDVRSGFGDVRVRPYGYDRTVLEFHAPEGVAMVHARTVELRRFLLRTQSAVPMGLEHLHLDIDHNLDVLLRDAA